MRNFFQPNMKKLFILFVAAVCFVGCARYDVSLSNGTRLNNVRKPVLNKKTGVYTIKMLNGNKIEVPEYRIREIQPHVKSKVKHKGSYNSDFFIKQ